MLIKEEVFGLIRVQPKRNYSPWMPNPLFSILIQFLTETNDIKFSNRVWNDPFNICRNNKFVLAFYKLNELTHAE